ncbi:DNA polymerase III subunit gamma and tau [Ornithinimicrobium flavum]|uniref:DNA polymerase III subunit gamma and tau n=1 Tax=Ornithinimicrobium flavum TaxID=1288636 RepID=UPI00106FC11C|nr:DNA polymerase III subunit gamma and tau [Ornithinimicrobium flavum]
MSTALYRRYRPESFADVIGQEHVTEPLMQALRSGRVNHAYLFSGPRGCGKTTSARILARCLNCEQGPTDTPCGTCESCVALARDGAGSVDVIEIDAASHGGVDDARDLRERAAFGPAQSRFKVYIIDEAHMVTPNGFNALLKVVEEPPPHVKFIFATTEPEKVLATIRSRTHHYPFHLVPPQRLTSYLEQLSAQEGVRLEPGVLSFVTRAGGGSVRDSLSVLDQLISGAGEEGLTYERTAALLGFTDVELLDSVVDAVAAGDAATVFQQVDRVMESGHDPRRFVEDLLERYRDLIVLAAVGEQAGGLLPGLPPDQVERMRLQSRTYGPAALSHAADLVARGLSEMAGAVSYRLMLELLAARLLLPAAAGEEGYAARLDRLERRLSSGAGVDVPAPAARPVRGRAQPGQAEGPTGGPPGGQRAPGPQGGEVVSGAQGDPVDAGPRGGGPSRPDPREDVPTGPDTEGAARPGALDTAALRRSWPDILAAVREISRRTAAGLEQAQVLDFDGRRLLVGFPAESWVRHFTGTSHEEALRQGVLDALALDTRIEAAVQRDPEPRTQTGPQRMAPPQDQAPPQSETGPPPSGTAGDSPHPPVGGGHQQGRVRRRSDEADRDGRSASPAPSAAPQVRVRGRGTAGQPQGGPTGDPQRTAPSMAEQLGAVGRTGADSGPDWAQTARSAAAPAWATSEGAPEGGSSDGAPAGRDADRERGVPAEGGPPPEEREAVRDERGPASAPVQEDVSSPPTGHRPGQVRTRAAAQAPPPAPQPTTATSWADAPSADDEDLSSSGAVGQPVIETVLGGTVIDITEDRVG